MKIFLRLTESLMPVTIGSADLQGMRGLDALLTALKRDGANALVAFGEAALQKGDRQIDAARPWLESGSSAAGR